MKTRLLLFFLMLTFTVFSQHNALDSAWIREHYVKIEQYIPMRDGVKLFTSIYMPRDTTEKHPILMNRTPYSCAPYGADKWRAFWDNHWSYYMREGYIIVIQDVRGRWMSEGSFVDIRPFNPEKKSAKDIDEASDTYDTIDWLVDNLPGNNGRVGVFGISYPGFYSTMAAISGHPALRAVSPQAPVTEWFLGDDFHHNGAFFLLDGFSFYSSFGQPRPEPTTVGPARFNFPVEDNYKFFLETGALKNFNSKYFGDSIAFWNELMQHPNYDEWWKARDPRNFVQDLKPAMLVVGGLFDAEDCYGAWRLYEAIARKSPKTDHRLVMGPWAHGQWARQAGNQLGHINFESNTAHWYLNHVEIPFFNYHLKGKGSLANLAKATIFFTGANRWAHLPQWPPAQLDTKHIYLQPGGGLSWKKPVGSGSYSEYISDPQKPVPYADGVHLRRTREYMLDDQRFAARRPDVLVFETPVLEEELTLAGTVIADIKASISTTDADFVVKIIDVFPDTFSYAGGGNYPMGAYQMLVRGEIMRGRYRKSFEKPEAFTPNKVETVRFELPDIAHTFKKGHRLMIQIQSSWFPLADRNPQQFINIYTCDDSDFKKSTIRIHHDSTHSSAIILPVLTGQ
jgi:putative CocE/NonD family hydrolase